MAACDRPSSAAATRERVLTFTYASGWNWVAGRSEDAAELKLESLDFVVVFLVQRVAEAELERPDRRAPRERKAGTVAQVVEADILLDEAVAPERLLVFAPHVAGVEERRHAERTVLARSRHREIELGVADHLARTTGRRDVAVGVAELRTNGALVVAPYRTDAANVIVLVERHLLAAETLGPTHVGVEHQRVVAADREPVLILVAELAVAKIANRHRHLAVHALVSTGARIGEAVTVIARPAH